MSSRRPRSIPLGGSYRQVSLYKSSPSYTLLVAQVTYHLAFRYHQKCATNTIHGFMFTKAIWKSIWLMAKPGEMATVSEIKRNHSTISLTKWIAYLCEMYEMYLGIVSCRWLSSLLYLFIQFVFACLIVAWLMGVAIYDFHSRLTWLRSIPQKHS